MTDNLDKASLFYCLSHWIQHINIKRHTHDPSLCMGPYQLHCNVLWESQLFLVAQVGMCQTRFLKAAAEFEYLLHGSFKVS